jgi:hypothetical protein
MKAFRSPRTTDRTDCRHQFAIDRPALVMAVLLLLLMIAAVGCDIATDLPSTTMASTGSTSMTVALETTSTLAPTTSTLAPTTSTLAPTTSTTVAEETTSTVAPTTTLAPTTTSTLAVTTTLPPLVIADTAQQPAGTVLYEISDWSSGVSGWAATGQWKTAGGMLVTDGSSDSFAVAPVDLTGHADYVVECEAQIVDPKAGTDVLLMARMINGQGYWGGFDGSASQMVVGYGMSALGSSNFVLDSNWHKYRLEVRGNVVKLYLEQAEVARAVDNRALEAGTVGIYCASGQINVRSFKVVAL